MEPSHIEAERLLTPSLLKICLLPGWWTKISTMQLLCRMYLNYVWISVCPLFQESSWSGPESSSLQQPETRFLRVLEKKKFDVRSFSRHVEIFCETAMKCLGVFFSCSLWLSKLSEKISQRWQAAAELNWIRVFVWRASAGCQNNVNVTVGSGLLAVFKCSDLLSSWEVESADLLAVKLLDKLSL